MSSVWWLVVQRRRHSTLTHQCLKRGAASNPHLGRGHLLSVTSEDVLKEFVLKGRLCAYRETIYFYCDETMNWTQLCSPQGAGIFTRLLDLNAPVNYARAMGSLHRVDIRSCPHVRSVPRSVCIAEERLSDRIRYGAVV